MLVEVRGFAARCARSFRCGGCAALRAARQTLARLLRSAPQTGFEPHAPSLGMEKPRRSEAFGFLVEVRGFEPLASGLQSPRSPS